MVETALHANMRPFALAIMIGFSGNLRPSDLLMTQTTDLVPSQTCADARRRHWGLLCPTELDVPSKTLAFDESVMLDSPWMTWATPWIAALHQQPQIQSIWPFDQLAYNKTFHSIEAPENITFLGVEPHSLRHSTRYKKENPCPPTNRHADRPSKSHFQH